MKPRIVVIGSSNTDMIIKLPRLPRPGETVLGGEFFTAAGGKGANQAVAAARAGGDVTFIAKVGDDLFGKQAVEGFAFDGLHCQHVFVDKETRSGVALIFIDSIGENVIGVSSGANLKLTPEDVQQAGQAITEANLLLMQLESPPETVLAAARIAAKNRVPIMLNPAPAKPLDDELLQLITYLTPNESETEMLINTKFQDDTSYSLAANILFSRGVKNVLITLGNRGVFVAPQGQQKHSSLPSRSRPWIPLLPAMPSTAPWPWPWPKNAA